ncbi:isopeptide-forming domain-containing fimbrial protein [Canibacter sp. lx-72]|uniref:SpaH/EbpB family LPXTG-anchored major pilin n=1 Tax=Canibacter zhuwentaonis TaxID=2837491 RepID=UPI001BDC980A|nr:isopeptide-forming domain-containing fimbrial protein [Canibacter zhuwentaonis]
MVYQTGQTVAGVGVATGQNTMLQQVAGGKPVKPTTTTTSLQPNNTGANNTSKTKPATNTKPPHISQLPAGVNRTAFIPDLVKTTTTTNKTEYYPGEAASIQVSFSYNDAAYQEVQDIQSNQDSYTVKINFNVQLPTGFTISPETLTRGPFTRDCTNQLACTLSGFQWNYNQQSRTLTGSLSSYHSKDDGAAQLFDDTVLIKGTATNHIGSHTVRTTADGVIQFPIGKLGGAATSEPFTAVASQAMFRVVSRKTVLKASFTPVGLTEGQVVVRGDVTCTVRGQQTKRNIMFTLKYSERVNGKWDRSLHDMVDVGSNCTVTLNKGMVSAGWRWKTNTPIVVTESNITIPRTATIRLEVEKIPVEVSTETTIVRKHKQQTPQGRPGTGQPETPAGDAIAGVEFKIQKLNLDLTQNNDWDMLKTLTPDAAKNRLVGFEATRTTNDNGEARFDNLAVGAYLVTETNAPDNVVKKAAPFIVTIPHPNGNNTWNYNVHVYPKNTVSAKPSKTLDDTGATKLGDKVTWTITQTLPELQQGETFTEVSFTDQLQEGLEYVAPTTAQVDGREVNVTVTSTGDGNRTLAGHLDDTTTLTGGETVTFKITTTVNTPGKIVNTANVRITTSNGGDTTPVVADTSTGLLP